VGGSLDRSSLADTATGGSDDRSVLGSEDELLEEKGPVRSAAARSEVGSGSSRRLRRIRARSKRVKLASLCGLASFLVVVVVYGLVEGNVTSDPDGGRAAGTADGAEAGVTRAARRRKAL
jgi:hypothetical protein